MFFWVFFPLFCSSRGAVEQDKLKCTVVADRGDEATLGKCGMETVSVKELSGRIVLLNAKSTLRVCQHSQAEL